MRIRQIQLAGASHCVKLPHACLEAENIELNVVDFYILSLYIHSCVCVCLCGQIRLATQML